MALAVSLPPALDHSPSHEQLGSKGAENASSTANHSGGVTPVPLDTSSPPHSPSTSGSSFAVPFPYSVALPYIPNSNPNLTGYFAGSANQPLPDDSDVQTRLPSICVDYLSHNWIESDIWKSWRAMTKHKAELANGVRLENASWRTWAKQRNKLRTISPETLNWLKDSDVTWLYGPLHTAVDPVPPAKAATMEDRLNLDPQTQARHAATPIVGQSKDVRTSTAKAGRSLVPTKPILKYRSLSDILSVPTHRHLAEYHYDEGEEVPEDRMDSAGTPRPGMPHRSDMAVPRAAPRRTPTPTVGERGDRQESPEVAAGPTTPSDDRSASADELEPPRKHISFNHFVEQCIAVDSDDDPSLFESGSSATSEDDDEDDEDEALSFRSSPRSAAFPLAKTQPLHFEREKEPHTIAKLAPTVLKSSELVYPSPSPAVVFNGQVIGGNIPFGTNANGVHWDVPDQQPLPSPIASGHNLSRWEHEEDFGAVGYDFFEGNADLGVGDEYTSNGVSGAIRKGGLRTPTEQSPTSSSGPSSPNLTAADAAKSSAGRSILKSRVPGPYSGDAQAAAESAPPLYIQTSPTAATYAEAVKAPLPSPIQRGRSISRGSSSSSLDRSASADGRRSSPHVGIEPERGRSFRRNNSSGSSLNILGTSPSSVASDVTIPARGRKDAEHEAVPSPNLGDSSATPSSSSSSASLPSRDDAGPSRPSVQMNEPPDRSKTLRARDFAHDDADFDKDSTFLFDSPHMPSSPTSSSIGLPRNNSFSTALSSVRWSDDEPSAARRALLRAQSRDSAASGIGRRFSQSSELVDDYGLNFAGFSDDEDSGGIVGRAVEIVGTARELVGALWTVAFRR